MLYKLPHRLKPQRRPRYLGEREANQKAPRPSTRSCDSKSHVTSWRGGANSEGFEKAKKYVWALGSKTSNSAGEKYSAPRLILISLFTMF